jgi:hypothetical protein
MDEREVPDNGEVGSGVDAFGTIFLSRGRTSPSYPRLTGFQQRVDLELTNMPLPC